MTLVCNNLKKTFRRRQPVPVLTGVDLQLENGQCMAIRGASGSGKSTLLMALGTLLKPDEGSVQFENRDVYNLSSAERAELRNKKFGFVYQTFHLIPYLTVLENVLLITGNNNRRIAATDLLSRLGLSHRLDHRPAALSAGEQQRTAVARAMINEPQVILADEPTGNLDAENSAAVYGALGEFRDAGGSVLVVTHGSAADSIADASYTLRDGRLATGDD